jgi:predicted O-methyltransferase YrrM
MARGDADPDRAGRDLTGQERRTTAPTDRAGDRSPAESNPSSSAVDELPPLVLRAQTLAQRAGFPLTRRQAGHGGPSASLPGVGRFLAMLAAGCLGGRIGELGTGIGIGAAWMASTMPTDCVLITVEIDQHRAATARELLSVDPRVEVITGDAVRVLSTRAPFDLLFSDGGAGHDQAALVDLLRIGGRIVNDDVTPHKALPPDSPFLTDDPKRRFFFSDSRLVSTEVVLPDLQNSLLVGTRIR